MARVTEIAPRIFTDREQAQWRGEADAQAAARFALNRWTLKEAYAKGRGLGLKLDFSGFGFVERDGAWRLDAPPAGDPRPQDWRFFTFVPWPDACGALAVLPRGGEVQWRLLQVTL
jgi:4'-phosphopantetheinyl transferase